MSVANEVQAVFKASSRQSTLRTVGSQRSSREGQARLEVFWAWASLLVLIVCWDAAFRLDERVSLPRMRIAHAVDQERSEQRMEFVEP